MKNKSILLILLFFILANCGFEPIYSSKKSNFNIGEIKITNKNKFNSIIKNNLKNISNNESQNKFDLIINSEKKRIISSKDTKGNPQLLTMIISVEVQIIKDNVIKNKKNFSQNFSYSNNSNKFSLAQYEKDIEKNLINKIIENINTYLLSL
jgi:outer membrane lipopolysaccharide assembly protein LptE/RlpB|tara:strand:+ start:54 stop:509 length:456 start_codon:yes stop_codon:yes gene_type:complete